MGTDSESLTQGHAVRELLECQPRVFSLNLESFWMRKKHREEIP
jgi:hypothetical protein